MPNNEKFLETAAGGAALGLGSGLIDNISNQIFGAINQKRQLKGLDKSLQLQNKYALDIWEKTGYGAQKKQMEEAGINPALLYGMSGGGAQTIGNATGAMPTSPGSKGMGIEQGIQLALLQSQIKVNESEANKNNAEANATGGYRKDLAGAQTGEHIARTGLINVDRELKDLDLWWNQKSFNDRLDYITATAEKAKEEVKQAKVTTGIAQNTEKAATETIKLKAVNQLLQNLLTGEQISLAKGQQQEIQSRIQLNQAQINKFAAEISQNWVNLNRNERELQLKQWVELMNKNFPSILNVTGKYFNDILEGFNKIIGGGMTYEKPEYNK